MDTPPYDAAGNAAFEQMLTSCETEVSEDLMPAIACDESRPPPTNCTPHEPCGKVTGCQIDRNVAIDGNIAAVYERDPAFVPPEPPHWPGVEPLAPVGTWMQGSATGWFGKPPYDPSWDRGTACNIPLQKDLMSVAMSATQFGVLNDGSFSYNYDDNVPNYSYWCGGCAELVGRSGRRILVQINNICTGCEPFRLDIPMNSGNDPRNDTPFNLIDDENQTNNVCTEHSGGQPIQWRLVPCEVCGGIVLKWHGFNIHSQVFQILNHRIPIVGADIWLHNQWVSVHRGGNLFYLKLDSNEEKAGPHKIRVRAIDGATITGTFPAYEDGKAYEADKQF